MFGQFVKDICGRSDGIGTQKKLQTGFLGGRYQAVGRGLVAGDVHIAALRLVLTLDAVGGRYGGMGVAGIVVAGLHHLDIVDRQMGLLGKLLLQEIGDEFAVAVE